MLCIISHTGSLMHQKIVSRYICRADMQNAYIPFYRVAKLMVNSISEYFSRVNKFKPHSSIVFYRGKKV